MADSRPRGDTFWQPDLSRHEGPKYLALVRALRDAVRAGELMPTERLPPVRELAWLLKITPGTVARAYQIATQEGLLEASVGRGTYVAATAARLGPKEPLYIDRAAGRALDEAVVDLRAPQLPEVGQIEAIATAMRAAADEVGPHYLEYPGLRRDWACRRAMVEWLSCRSLGPVAEDDLVLTHGGQNAISIMLQCCLRGERPVVFAEELAYPGFRHAARLCRAEVIPIALDGEGMRPDALEAACRRHGGRVVTLTPEAQNPTAARMGPARRAEIVAVARRHDLQILEDVCYAGPPRDAEALRALAPERSWFVTSLSKSLSAGLRFGVLLCPVGMGEAGRLTAQHSFFGLAPPVTDIVTRLLVSGETARLSAAAQAVMERRLALAVAALGRPDGRPGPHPQSGHELIWQPGVSFIWLRLPTGWRASTFTRMAEAEGVLLRSADEYTLVDGHAPSAVRLAIAGGIPEARFAAAVETLAQLLHNPPGDLPV